MRGVKEVTGKIWWASVGEYSFGGSLDNGDPGEGVHALIVKQLALI